MKIGNLKINLVLIKGRYVREEDFRVVRGEASCTSDRGLG